MQSKLERQRVSYGRRTAQLSAWSTACKYKLEHLVSKFRKLKACSVDPMACFVEENKNLKYNETLAPARIKENNMAKFNLDIKNVTLGSNVVVGDAVISVEVPDDLFTTCVNNLTKLTEIMCSPPKSTCTCHANDEDKRPPENKIRVMHHPGKTAGKRDNPFAPMDVE